MVDTDGDGFRELPNGDAIVLNMQFATQGIGGEVVELVARTGPMSACQRCQRGDAGRVPLGSILEPA